MKYLLFIVVIVLLCGCDSIDKRACISDCVDEFKDNNVSLQACLEACKTIGSD
jgi:hypothetical protein